VLRKLFDTLGARFTSRPGGYTRILRLGPRRGDGAEMAILELLGSEYQPEKKGDKDKKPAAKAAPKGEAKGAKAPAGKKAAKGTKAEAKAGE
jgi:large subunit ribosomal protein L17